MHTAPTPSPDDFDLSVLPSSEPYHTIAEDVSSGLSKDPPELSERYFYDEAGSDLFEQICQTEDYYPTRTEEALIETHSSSIIGLTEPKRIIELGSGSSVKTRKLFDNPALREFCSAYVAIDVSRSALEQSMQALSADYPWLRCQAVAGDYGDALESIDSDPGQRSLYLFLGGTIGNFHPDAAVSFLSGLRAKMGADDCLLIGIDAVKAVETIKRAYNDKEQYTAQFNLNVLRVVNRELGADFDLGKFRHRAEYRDDLNAIQMSLESTDNQVVSIPSLDKIFDFKAGERIITEHSYKYTRERASEMLRKAGFATKQIFGDSYHLIVASPLGSG